MKRIFALFCLIITALSASAQSTDTLSADTLRLRQTPELAALAQRGSRYLALDRSSLGGFHRLRFYNGQTFSFRYSNGRRYKERIHAITDSSFVLVLENPNNFLDEARHFRVDQVERIYTSRYVPFVTQGAYMLPLAGGVYLLADVVNTGVVNNSSLITAGALAAVGVLCHRLTNIRIPLNRNNRLRIFSTN